MIAHPSRGRLVTLKTLPKPEINKSILSRASVTKMRIDSLIPDQDPIEQLNIVHLNFLAEITKAAKGSQELTMYDPSTILNKISLEKNMDSTAHLDMDTPSVEFEEYNGSLLNLNSSIKSFTKFREQDLSDIDCIALGGMDFYTLPHFGALRSCMNRLSLACTSSVYTDENTLYYYPMLTKQDRYKELMNFHRQELYASAEMQRLASLYIVPKILKEEKLFLFGFSASCREIIMLENICRRYIDNAFQDKAKVSELMSNVSALLFGYAFDKPSNEIGSFNKILITSIEDFAVLRSDYNIKLLYGHSVFNYGISIISHMSPDNNTKAIIFGAGSVPRSLSGKINTNGHHLGHYIAGVSQLMETTCKEANK